MTLDDYQAEQRAAEEELAALTTRQREVLVLMCKGLTNAMIATTLGVSPKTVEVHRSRGLQSLEMTTVEAVVLATRARWV